MSLHRFTCGTDPLSVSSVWHSPWICFCCCWKSAGSRFKALLSLSLVVLEERPWPPRSVDLVQGCLLLSFVVRPEVQYKFPVRKLPLAKHFRNMTNFWKDQKNFSSNSLPWPRRRRPCPRLSVSLQNHERGEIAGSLRTCPWPWPWYIGRPDQIWTRWRPWPWYDDPDEGLNVL